MPAAFVKLELRDARFFLTPGEIRIEQSGDSESSRGDRLCQPMDMNGSLRAPLDLGRFPFAGPVVGELDLVGCLFRCLFFLLYFDISPLPVAGYVLEVVVN